MTKNQKMKHGVNKWICSSKRVCFWVIDRRFQHSTVTDQLTIVNKKRNTNTLIGTTPFTQLLPTQVCFTNAGVNTYGADIHKVRKHAIYAFPSFLFLILLFRLYVKEPFSEM